MAYPYFTAEPLKFYPVYKDYIWGGRNLEKLGRTLPPGRIAESWELSGHPEGVSIIANGEWAGTTFPEYLRRFGEKAVGSALPREYVLDFPLLIKLIDANEKLSVQVHPDDDYAKQFEGGKRGKNEMWYVLAAEPEAEIIYGLRKGTDRNTFARAVSEERIGDCLRPVEVRAGDVFDIPAGVVHGIGAGILLAEIQQSSNLTYRIFDYHRRDDRGNARPLHIEKALDVIDFGDSAMRFGESRTGDGDGVLAANRDFRVELKTTRTVISGRADGERFYILVFLSGNGLLRYRGGELPVKQAETVFIPAAMGEYQLEGPLEFLEVKVP